MTDEFTEVVESLLEYMNVKDINRISKSKFKNGENIFTDSNVTFLYHFCGYLKKYGESKCLEYINYLETLDEWEDKIENTEPGRTFEDIEEEKLNRRKNHKLPSLKGLIKCRKCGSDNVLETNRVGRADEEAITIIMCMSCRNRIR